ncbi:DEAD/DEAH box helicase [Synechococcus virus S-ESS1]|uniref:DEAD/DEAH box helicase n=1 Tax=Synechococcus virus S-ESS1 TaxID=1964565 RepID=A0A1V0DX49_9CAUD|nr:DEAD/DEAH box helicase [Synechococcus virus S-ESS1]ARB05700.1 DEAD/DEAH box helicase [Synechococcus virus S-ESS1]
MKHVAPKHLTDIEALELLYGPPPEIFTYAMFRPYQAWMAQQIIDLKGVYLGAEMGLGKTAASLYAIKTLMNRGVIKNVLIIAPLRVAEETWPEEIAKWDFARDITYRVVTGDLAERKAALRVPARITITNRENLLWLLKGLGLKRWNFDMIVYDEGSRLKRGVDRTNPKPRKDGTVRDPQLTELGRPAASARQDDQDRHPVWNTLTERPDRPLRPDQSYRQRRAPRSVDDGLQAALVP